jgi:hypothetical protein
LSDRGSIDVDQVVNDALTAGQTHLWLFSALADDVITITVAPAAGLDLELTVRNAQGIKIRRRDDAGAGQAEIVAGLELAEGDGCQILVTETNDEPGDYALVVLDGSSIPIQFPGNLTYGESVSGALAAGTHHIWHFSGTAGDSITIRLTPEGNSDLIFTFYGPNMASPPIGREDAGFAGTPEEGSYQLAETGFYSIGVEEYGRMPADYLVLVTRE